MTDGGVSQPQPLVGAISSITTWAVAMAVGVQALSLITIMLSRWRHRRTRCRRGGGGARQHYGRITTVVPQIQTKSFGDRRPWRGDGGESARGSDRASAAVNAASTAAAAASSLLSSATAVGDDGGSSAGAIMGNFGVGGVGGGSAGGGWSKERFDDDEVSSARGRWKRAGAAAAKTLLAAPGVLAAGTVVRAVKKAATTKDGGGGGRQYPAGQQDGMVAPSAIPASSSSSSSSLSSTAATPAQVTWSASGNNKARATRRKEKPPQPNNQTVIHMPVPVPYPVPTDLFTSADVRRVADMKRKIDQARKKERQLIRQHQLYHDARPDGDGGAGNGEGLVDGGAVVVRIPVPTPYPVPFDRSVFDDDNVFVAGLGGGGLGGGGGGGGTADDDTSGRARADDLASRMRQVYKRANSGPADRLRLSRASPWPSNTTNHYQNDRVPRDGYKKHLPDVAGEDQEDGDDTNHDNDDLKSNSVEDNASSNDDGFDSDEDDTYDYDDDEDNEVGENDEGENYCDDGQHEHLEGDDTALPFLTMDNSDYNDGSSKVDGYGYGVDKVDRQLLHDASFAPSTPTPDTAAPVRTGRPWPADASSSSSPGEGESDRSRLVVATKGHHGVSDSSPLPPRDDLVATQRLGEFIDVTKFEAELNSVVDALRAFLVAEGCHSGANDETTGITEAGELTVAAGDACLHGIGRRAAEDKLRAMRVPLKATTGTAVSGRGQVPRRRQSLATESSSGATVDRAPPSNRGINDAAAASGLVAELGSLAHVSAMGDDGARLFEVNVFGDNDVGIVCSALERAGYACTTTGRCISAVAPETSPAAPNGAAAASAADVDTDEGGSVPTALLAREDANVALRKVRERWLSELRAAHAASLESSGGTKKIKTKSKKKSGGGRQHRTEGSLPTLASLEGVVRGITDRHVERAFGLAQGG